MAHHFEGIQLSGTCFIQVTTWWLEVWFAAFIFTLLINKRVMW
jgi:hypothetical protein